MSEKLPSQVAGSQRRVYRGRIERILDRAADVRSVFMHIENQTLPAFAPGMFISVSIPLGDEVRVRPYTIASNYEDGEPLELVLDRVPNGHGSAWLFDRRVGDEFDFTGPFGLFTLTEQPQAELIFMAEGTAIAPIRPMLHRMLKQPLTHPIRLLYAASSTEHLLYHTEFEAWQNRLADFEYTTIIEKSRSQGYLRLLEQAQRRWGQSNLDRSRSFYICGIGHGIIEIRDLLRNAGYERRAVHYEKW